MKKKWIILLIILILLATAIGCTVKFFRKDHRPKVVVVLKELNIQYWKIVKAGAEKGFRDFDVDGKVIATRDASAEEQNDILENVLKEKPDVLIVSPLFSSNIPILKEFDKNNIPVLLVDTDDPWESKTSYIGTDNYELGRKAGELLASDLQPGDEVVLLAEDLTSTGSVIVERIKGAAGSLEDAGVKIVIETVKLPIEPSGVKKAMRKILQNYPNVKGVFAPTDTMALNAVEVIEEHGLEIPVTGTDGLIEMIKLIEDKTLTGTVAQNPYDMGYISVETAWKVIKGERVKKNIDTGVDFITTDNAKQKLDFVKEVLK